MPRFFIIVTKNKNKRNRRNLYMKEQLAEKIAGCLVGAAYGDALGAPTENRTREQIFEKWGFVNSLMDAPSDVYARGNKAGQITDDFSMAYSAIQAILDADGEISNEVAEEALIKWSENERFFDQFVGPTSRKFINQLKGQIVETDEKFEPVNDNMRASNGGAMKIGPVSCFGKGNIEQAIKIAYIICAPTHKNRIAMSAACAVAAAVNSALAERSLTQIFQDAIYGAEAGEKLGETGNIVAGPSLKKRLKVALTIGIESNNLSEAMDTLRKYFDCSGMAADSVPVAFGLMAAAKGNVVEGVQAAVNIGNDTDTIATIVGAVLGAYKGANAFSKEIIDTINAANEYDLMKLAYIIFDTDIKIEK